MPADNGETEIALGQEEGVALRNIRFRDTVEIASANNVVRNTNIAVDKDDSEEDIKQVKEDDRYKDKHLIYGVKDSVPIQILVIGALQVR